MIGNGRYRIAGHGFAIQLYRFHHIGVKLGGNTSSDELQQNNNTYYLDTAAG